MNGDFSKYIDCIKSLKTLVRTGWMLRGVPPAMGETVSGHSFEAALIGIYLSYYLSNAGISLSPQKIASLAVLHDLVECEIGDIPPKKSNYLKSLKEEAESEVMKEMPLPEEISKLLREYYEQGTKEAIIARLSEKLATVIEAIRLYEMGFVYVKDIIDNTMQEINEILKNIDKSERELILGLLREIPKDPFRAI